MALEKNLLSLLSLQFKGRDRNFFFSKHPNSSFIYSVSQQMFIQCLLDAVCVGHTSDNQHQHTNHPPWEVFSYAHTAPTWLLFGSLSFAPSFSSLPLFFVCLKQKTRIILLLLKFKPCPLGLIFYSTHSFIQPRFTECSSSKQ